MKDAVNEDDQHKQEEKEKEKQEYAVEEVNEYTKQEGEVNEDDDFKQEAVGGRQRRGERRETHKTDGKKEGGRGESE